MKSSDFKKVALSKIRGNLSKVLLISLTYVLISAAISFTANLFPENYRLYPKVVETLLNIPINFGLIISFLKLFNGEKVKTFEYLISGFGNMYKSWGIALRMLLKMIVPIILIIISIFIFLLGYVGSLNSEISKSVPSEVFIAIGIIGLIGLIASSIWATIKNYLYQLSYIISADNSDFSAKEAVQKSEELMKGNRIKLFSLQFSFLPWLIFGIVSFGIGLIWVVPYMQFATIAFYYNLKNEKKELS